MSFGTRVLGQHQNNRGIRSMASFGRDVAGGVAVMFGLLSLVIMGMVALAVDYTRSQRIQTNAQQALDAAALAAARAASTESGDPKTVAETYYEANFVTKNDTTAVSLKTHVDTERKMIRLDATTKMQTSFARVLGIETSTFKLASEAVYGNTATEIVLVLDNTASMAGTKLEGLKAAAKELVDAVYSQPGTDESVKIGIVPFAQYVNVGLGNRNASWLDVPPDSSTTTYSCWSHYPNATTSNCRTVDSTYYTDGVPYSCTSTQCDWDYGNPVEVCGDSTTTNTWNGCVGSRNYPLDVQTATGFGSRVPGIMNASCNSELTRLTNAKSDVLTKIDSMSAVGETFVQPGLIWGWRVLDSNEPFGDGFNPATNPDGRKYMVVMTDGANTKSPIYPDHVGSDRTLSNGLTTETCTNIKAKGVVIYTVAFGVTDSDIQAVLRGCATASGHAYEAADASALSNVFQEIAKSMTMVRIDR